MSRSSRDYYHSSRSLTLPPIRDVIGDVLEQPAQPGDSSRSSRTSTRSAHGYDTSHSASPLHLPPIRSSRESESSRRRSREGPSPPSRDYHMQSPSPPPYQSYRRQEFSPPPRPSTSHSSYSKDYRMLSPSPRPVSRASQRQQYPPQPSSSRFDVFVATSDQGLVHKRSSVNDDFHQVTKEDAIATSTGKHVCAECQRRFEKLSTLKNHLTTHSGERPHECPDCGKTFSVYTNMRRHQLIHRRPGTSD